MPCANFLKLSRSAHGIRPLPEPWPFVNRDPRRAKNLVPGVMRPRRRIGKVVAIPVAISGDDSGGFCGILGCSSVQGNIPRMPLIIGNYVVTPAGFEPAISTLKGSRPWPG